MAAILSRGDELSYEQGCFCKHGDKAEKYRKSCSWYTQFLMNISLFGFNLYTLSYIFIVLYKIYVYDLTYVFHLWINTPVAISNASYV